MTIDLVDAGKKDIYIYPSHNQVLNAWGIDYSRNVFSLDYHTDTKRAFQNYAYWRADSEIKSGQKLNHEERAEELAEEKIRQYMHKEISLEKIQYNLKHDEHLDFAVRTQSIGTAFALTKNSNLRSSNPNVYIAQSGEAYQNQRIIEYTPHPEEDPAHWADLAIDDRLLQQGIHRASSLHPRFFDNYILDIDCDYFNTDKSLNPENRDVFQKLVRDCRFITIALEAECVKICRHPGCLLTSQDILEQLISLMAQ